MLQTAKAFIANNRYSASASKHKCVKDIGNEINDYPPREKTCKYDRIVWHFTSNIHCEEVK